MLGPRLVNAKDREADSRAHGGKREAQARLKRPPPFRRPCGETRPHRAAAQCGLFAFCRPRTCDARVARQSAGVERTVARGALYVRRSAERKRLQRSSPPMCPGVKGAAASGRAVRLFAFRRRPGGMLAA
jgi:hypothetical protein